MSADTKEEVKNKKRKIKDIQSLDFSSKEKNNLLSVLENSNIFSIERGKKIEKIFQNALEAQEFKKLKTLVIDSLYRISWEKLIQDGVVNIKNKKVEWIYWKEDLNLISTKIKSLWKIKKIEGYLKAWDLETLEDLGELEETKSQVNIIWTSIKSLWKLKNIWEDLHCWYLETLENLWNLEYVWGYLDIRWTKVKTFWKLKSVEGNVDSENIKTLEDLWDLEYVWGYLDITWISIKSLKNLKKVWGHLFCRNIYTLKDLWNLEYVWGYLQIIWTSIRNLWKLKKVWGNLDSQNIKTLQSIGEVEEVWGDLNIRGTNIKSLWKLKKIWGSFYCWYLRTLESIWELKEVGERFYILGTRIEIQLEVIKKYKENNLRIWGEIFFWWYLKIIEKLVEQKSNMKWNKKTKKEKLSWKDKTISPKKVALEWIPWTLDLTTIDIQKQLDIMCKRKAWKLKIKNILVSEELNKIFNKLYQKGKINFNKYRKVFGENINQIEDKEMKTIWEEILRIEYKKIKNKIEEKGKQIIDENKWKKLTNEEKNSIRKQILELDRELKFQKEKIESFGIKL